MLPHLRSEGLGGWRDWEEVRARCCPVALSALGLEFYALATLIRTAYAWALRCPGQLTAPTAVLAMVLLALRSALRDGILISSESFSPLSRGYTTFLEPPMDYLEQYYSAASAAPCVLLLPVSHIAESAGDKIEVIIVPSAFPPMVPSAIARTKKKRKKAAALAVPAAASNNTSAATPMPSTTAATKKGKKTGKKKSAKPVNLRATPMWAKSTDGTSHCVVAIPHGQKWVVGNAATMNGDIADKPLSDRQCYQKGPSGKRIAPGNRTLLTCCEGGRG
jgi:hypothetical protein